MAPSTEVPLSNFITGQSSQTALPLDAQIPGILRAIRTHLGMDVAFVSEFAAGRRVFRHVDSPHANQPVKVGNSDPLEESYCQRVIDGRLPELIRDASKIPEAMHLPVTRALPVGAHMSVPVKLRDGSLYGTFCCFSFAANQTLNDRDLQMMHVFADLAGDQIERDIQSTRLQTEIEGRIRAMLSSDDPSAVYQPIIHVAENRIVGYEALSRFSALPKRTPDIWFTEAAQVGLGITLETKAIRRALMGATRLPADVYVSVNASPEVILQADLENVFNGFPLQRLVLEVTEHAAIDNYDDLATVLEPLRRKGLRLAVDDAGAGYASFRHILALAPDVIKLDISITRNIDTDRSRRALAAALIGFAMATGSKIVAEGVETAAELLTLRQLGVNKAQGYFFGRPMPLAQALERIREIA